MAWAATTKRADRSMASPGADPARRPAFPAAANGHGDEEVSGGAVAAPVFLLATDKDRPVDPMIWGDEERMKRELVAWAKAVASVTVSKATSSFVRTRRGQ